jgi:hypothetical protein
MNSFKLKTGVELPVDNEKYLFPFLSPTTQGTHYRESQPEGGLTERQYGRVLLQLHQILHVLEEVGVDLKGRTLLDIGTGNGLIPRGLLAISELKSAVGVDPFSDGEHSTSWQPHNHDDAMRELMEKILPNREGILEFKAYAAIAGLENFQSRPHPIKISKDDGKPYTFHLLGAHQLSQMNEQFDVLYCKAIEHIHNWGKVFEEASAAAGPGAVFYLKHRSFFSYLGAHRYASIGTPWGHVLLGDEEYEEYVKRVYPSEADQMTAFFRDELARPRMTVHEMVTEAQKNNFMFKTVHFEAPRYIQKIFRYPDEIDGFWELTRERHPSLGAEEIFSGMIHIVFEKKGTDNE